MKQQSAKSSKALIVGIVAAVLLLIAVVAVLLTQCMGSFAPSAAEPTESTAALQAESTDLYWNLDRELYDGKSEAGMSSRKAESDGFFHVRFFKDGETVELRVSDRKVINKIDVNNLMGLVFDGDGIVVDIISPDRLPVQRVGWLFYVQSTGGNVIKLNSSKALNGLEAVLQIEEDTRIYDMTGVEGEVGKEIMPTNLDRVIAIADLEGKLTHVFVTDRSEYMNSFEADCQHCGQVVTWNAWTKTDELPVTTGHYQLQNNVQLKSQPMQKEDAKICIDLNGVRVDGGKDARCYAMFNPGVELAIMDTSEKQTGVIAPHGTGDQGMGVWVRYGAFYLYGGTIDGSDAVNEIYGTCVAVQKNAYMYMLGGTITGGKAGCVYDGKVYKRGLGGNVAIEGKLVINDGVISNGYAEAIISWDAKGQPVYNRGIGGNIYVMANGVLEINGGTIQNGLADGVGGNIYMDGSSELTMNGGLISGGTIKGRGKNGGSIYLGGKASFTLNGGCIRGGVSRNEGGCVYAAGLFTMNGGYIGGGRVYDYKTGKLKEDCASRNVFVVNNQFSMYGGRIDGGVHVIDSAAKDGKQAAVALGGYAVIDGGEASKNNLFLNTAGDGVKVYVGKMLDGSFVRVAATTGIFTQPTKEDNLDNFASDIPGAEILYYDGRLALGKLGCVCAHGTHIGQCDGTKHLWLPHTKTNTLPLTTGYWFLTDDVALAGQQKLAGGNAPVLDLNGKTVTGSSRGILLLESSSLVITDSIGGGSIATKGFTNDSGAVMVVGDGEASIYGGTLRQIVDEGISVSGGGVVRVDANGTLNLYDGTLIGGKVSGVGGTVRVNGILNIYGGTVTGGQATNGGSIGVNAGTVNLYGGTVEKGIATNGGNIFLANGTALNLLDGEPVITGGQMALSSGGNGGNIYAEAGSTVTMACGTIENGKALRDSAGNVYLKGTMVMTGGKLTGGHRNNGGSLDKRNLFCVNGDLTVTGGQIDGGVCVYGANTRLKVGKDARIVSNEAGKASLTLSAGALVEIKEALTGNASIVLSNNGNTRITNGGTAADKAYFLSDKDLTVALEADGSIWLRGHTHCSENCGGINGKHADGCSGTDESWIAWNGSAITESGRYCLEGTVAPSGQTIIENGLEVTLCLNGQTFSGSVRGFLVRGGAELTIMDCSGKGILEAKGYNNDSGGVIVVGDGTVNMLGGTVRLAGSNTVTGGGVFRVDAGGTLNIHGGTVTGGQAVNGGNIGINAGTVNLYGGTLEGGVANNGGNVYMANGTALKLLSGEPVITGGQMAVSTGGNGGNIYAEAGSAITMACGTIENGKALRDSAGNVYLKGSLTMSGGLITGGHRNNGGSLDKRNLFSVNGKLTVTGGQIDGGVCAYGTGGTLKLGKDARIVSSEAGKASLTLSAGALITFEGSLSSNASIVLSNAADTRICANGTADDKARITSDKGLKVTLEAGGMYLRAADAHVHCLCGRTDGTHAEGCDGFDVVFGAATAFPTTTGAYFVNVETLSTAALQLGKSDGTGAVDVVLCLNGKTVTTPNTNTARVALIWKNSSLTITDCGNGTIKPNAATAGNGAIFHPAAGSTLTLYNGTLDASGLSTAKNGAAIDNAGTLYIRGGTILGGLTTQRGGAVNNTGTLVMSGGRISGGRVGNRGGNIYSENGHVTISGGIIENGKAYADTAGNIDVRNGSLTISGGTISGGNRYTNNTFTTVHASGEVKRNIFTVNTNVTITGGQIDGGVQLYTSGSGSAKISGSPSIVSSEAGKKSLTTGYVLTILAPGLDEEARIQITSAPAGAFAVAESGLTLTSEMGACFENASGVKATLENNQLLFK